MEDGIEILSGLGTPRGGGGDGRAGCVSFPTLWRLLATSALRPAVLTYLRDGHVDLAAAAGTTTMMTRLPERLFCDCHDLRSVSIPASVTAIGDEAFHGCSSLSAIIMHHAAGGASPRDDDAAATSSSPQVTIGSFAFAFCTSLCSIAIPSSVRVIERATFFGCAALTSVTIPDGVQRIEGFAFRGCASLDTIHMGAAVTSIGYGAFRDCVALSTVAIPDAVEVIGKTAFLSCTALASVTIGA